MIPPTTLLRELIAAAGPFALRAERTPQSIIPDLVFSHPVDGRELARLRWFEPEGQPPFLHTIIPVEISRDEQLEVERHITEHVQPVIQRRFSYSAWLALAEPQPPGGDG
jgi:hypothetical protein